MAVVKARGNTVQRLGRSAGLAAILLVAPSCVHRDSVESAYPYTEMVIPVGATVTAVNANGKMLITATSITRRRYRWDDRDGSYALIPRIHRWYGSLGLYVSSAPMQGPGWSIDGVLTEYQIHFADALSAGRWLTAGAESPERLVWNSTGLAVAFQELPSRGQLDVDVLQVCIRGKKPQHLSGADDRSISITGADGRPAHTLTCADPGTVNNYEQ